MEWAAGKDQIESGWSLYCEESPGPSLSQLELLFSSHPIPKPSSSPVGSNTQLESDHFSPTLFLPFWPLVQTTIKSFCKSFSFLQELPSAFAYLQSTLDKAERDREAFNTVVLNLSCTLQSAGEFSKSSYVCT